MAKTNRMRGFVINEIVLGLPGVAAVIEREGAKGIGRLAVVCASMIKYYHTIGAFDRVPEMARKLKMRSSNLDEWIRNCGVFKITEDGKYFYFTYLRHLMHRGEVSQEEIDTLNEHGVQYRDVENEPKTDDEKGAETKMLRKSGEVSTTQDVHRNVVTTKLISSQPSDKEDVKPSPYSDSDIDINIYSDITNKMSNNHSNTTSSSECMTAAGDDESFFKIFERKILSASQWRKSTSVALCVNLVDDDAARCFARWMFNYCVSKGKVMCLDDEKWMLDYATNLLMQGMRTRRCYDAEYERFVDEQAKTEAARKAAEKRAAEVAAGTVPTRHVCHGSYEQIIDGVRYGLGNQPLPDDAPHQTDPDTRWSYIEGRWVKIGEWDEKREMEFYRNGGSTDALSVGDIIVGKIMPKLKLKKKATKKRRSKRNRK